MTLAPTQEAPRVQVRDGRVIVDLDWDDADSVREHLRRQGLRGTMSLDPATREASLTLWGAVNPALARQALSTWGR
jgi:hypothetical protein